MYRRLVAAVQRAKMSLELVVLKILMHATSSVSLVHTEANKIKVIMLQHFTKLLIHLTNLFYAAKKGEDGGENLIKHHTQLVLAISLLLMPLLHLLLLFLILKSWNCSKHFYVAPVADVPVVSRRYNCHIGRC